MTEPFDARFRTTAHTASMSANAYRVCRGEERPDRRVTLVDPEELSGGSVPGVNGHVMTRWSAASQETSRSASDPATAACCQVMRFPSTSEARVVESTIAMSPVTGNSARLCHIRWNWRREKATRRNGRSRDRLDGDAVGLRNRLWKQEVRLVEVFAGAESTTHSLPG